MRIAFNININKTLCFNRLPWWPGVPRVCQLFNSLSTTRHRNWALSTCVRIWMLLPWVGDFLPWRKSMRERGWMPRMYVGYVVANLYCRCCIILSLAKFISRLNINKNTYMFWISLGTSFTLFLEFIVYDDIMIIVICILFSLKYLITVNSDFITFIFKSICTYHTINIC